MTYDEAFEQSKMFIKRLGRLIYASEWYNLVEPCDFEQECKIKFYMELKNRYDPYTALKCSKRAYKQVLSRLMQKEIKHRKIYKAFVNYIEPKDVICGLPTQHSIPYGEIGLNDKEILICMRLLMGYRKHEIEEFTQDRWKVLRRKLINYYKIPTDKRGQVKYVTKTEAYQKYWDSKKGKPLDYCYVKTSKRVQMLDDSGNVLKEFNSAAEASRQVGRSVCRVSQAIANHYRCGGYQWKYVD